MYYLINKAVTIGYLSMGEESDIVSLTQAVSPSKRIPGKFKT